MTQDSQPDQSSPKGYGKKRRYGLILLSFVLLLPLILLLSVYLALRSPLMESQIWPRLQPLIAEQTGFDIQLQRLRVDLFSSIQLEGISVSQQNSDCGDFSLTLAQLQLDFDLFPLLNNHLQINQLLVRDLQASGCLMLDLNPVVIDDKTATTTEPLQQLGSLTELLENPPLSLDIQALQLDNISIDLEVRERQQQLFAHWTGEVNLDARVKWDDNGIITKVNSQISSEQPLQLQLKQSDSLDLTLLLQLQMAGELELLQKNQNWQLDLQPLQLDLAIQQLQLDLQQPEGSLQLNWPDYQLSLLGDLHTQLPAADANSWLLQLHWLMNSRLPTASLGLTTPELELSTRLQHQLETTLSGEINLLEPLLNQLLLDVQLQQGFQQLQLTLDTTSYQLQQAMLQLSALSQPLNQQGQLDTELQLSISQLDSPLSSQPLDLQQRLQLQLQQDLSGATLLAQTRLNQLDLLDLKLQLDNQADQLSMKPQLQLSLPRQLAEFFPAAEVLLQLGDLKLDLDGYSTLQHQQKLFEALSGNTLVAQLSNQYQLQISQQPGTAVNEGLWLQHPLDLQLQLHSPYPVIQPDIKLTLHSDGVHYPPLLQPLPFHLQLAASLNTALTQLTSDLQLELNKQPLLDWQLSLDDQPQTLSADSQLSLNLNPELKNYLAELAALDALGKLQLHKHLELTLRHSATSLQALDFDQPQDIQAQGSLNLTGEGLPPYRIEQTDSASIHLDAAVFPLHLSGQAQLLADGNTLNLQDVLLQLGNRWLEQQLSGQLTLDGQVAQVNGSTRITPRTSLLDGLDISSSGHLQLPWQITMVDGEIFSLNATADFHDLSLKMQDFSIEGLNGQLKLDEELLLTPDGNLAFRYLLTPEAFQRVDFNRMEPYLGESRDISFKQLKIGELSIGPLHATLPIRQNLFRLQQFNLGLFGGDMTGQFYLDATPGAWRIGLLSRISRLDLRQLLPVTRVGGYAPVSARTAIEFDLNQRLLEGRIDITDINRTQLLQLLDIIDPDHLDPQMNTVRSALRLAHPRWISAEMEYGMLHLTFGLSLFAEPLRVRGLPLSQIIERFGEEALILTDQLPLEK